MIESLVIQANNNVLYTWTSLRNMKKTTVVIMVMKEITKYSKLTLTYPISWHTAQVLTAMEQIMMLGNPRLSFALRIMGQAVTKPRRIHCLKSGIRNVTMETIVSVPLLLGIGKPTNIILRNKSIWTTLLIIL
jgi:hypothetical protein